MFPREKRLPRDHFTTALKGRRIHSKNFSAVVPHHGAGYSVVVSKKLVRLATARHVLKRRILAGLRALPLPAALVVFPKASAATLSFAEIKAELGDLTK